jgi:hypothetical protein
MSHIRCVQHHGVERLLQIDATICQSRSQIVDTLVQQEGNPFFSSHHNAGVKRMARVAARKMGASTSLEYFRPNTTITMAAAASNERMRGEPRTIMVFIVHCSFDGIFCM